MNLLDVALLPNNIEEKEARVVYTTGYQLALVTALKGRDELLQLDTQGSILNLDDNTVWRQKKVKEKAVQMFSLIVGDSIKAKVIRFAVSDLKNNGDANSKRLREGLMNVGYSEKTANAQASQMISLFKNLKVIMSNGKLNPDSLLFKRMIEAI